eukprot:SAG31_NODE_1722_length_7452_cov_2.771658_5_plen_40_part_00
MIGRAADANNIWPRRAVPAQRWLLAAGVLACMAAMGPCT